MALIKCTGCGHEISDRASTCPHCGNPVSPKDGNVCKECGIQLPVNADVCPNCGCPTGHVVIRYQEVNEEEPEKKKWWIWALAIALLCLIGGWAYFGFTNEPQEETKELVIEEKKDSVEMEAEVEVKEDIVELTPDFINAIKKYDGIDEFSDGYAAVSKGHKWGYINTKGDVAIPVTIDADCVGKFSEGLAIVIPFSSGEFYVIDSKGETVYKGNGYNGTWDAYIPYYINGKLYVQEGDKYQIYDRQGKKTGTVDIDVGNNIYKNHEIGEYSFFSKTHDDRYDGIGAYDETYGLKDISGRVIIAPEYDMIQGQGNSSTKISNGVVLVALTEYDESYDGGEDEHTIYHYGYADLKGNDTFTKALKEKCRQSKEIAMQTKTPDWLQGAWKIQFTDDNGNCLGFMYEVFNDGTSKTYMGASLISERQYRISDNMVIYDSGYYQLDKNRQLLIGADGREFTKVSSDRYFTP